MKKAVILALAASLSLSSAFTALAARDWHWEEGTGANAGKHKYLDSEFPDFPLKWWYCLDDDDDGVAEFYRFDENGWLLTNTVTPDGFTVNQDGAAVVNGEVQHAYRDDKKFSHVTYSNGTFTVPEGHVYANTAEDTVAQAGYTRGISNIAIDMLSLGNRALVDYKYEVEYAVPWTSHSDFDMLVKYKNIPFVVRYGNGMVSKDMYYYEGRMCEIVDISDTRNALVKDIQTPTNYLDAYHHLCDLGYPSIVGAFQYFNVTEEPRLNATILNIEEGNDRYGANPGNRIYVAVH